MSGHGHHKPDFFPIAEQSTEWRDQAACRTAPELFFPVDGGTVRRAKAICRRCPVTDACLKWAIDSEQDYGVWGGMTGQERSARRKAKAA